MLKALADWKAGKPVRGVELGQVHRMKEHPGMSPLIDSSEHLHNDQERAYAYCFHILEHFSNVEASSVPGLPSFETFTQICDGLEKDFRKETEGLTAEELDGAESLAWKALLVGWAKALDGHKDSAYIEVTSPKEKQSQRETAT